MHRGADAEGGDGDSYRGCGELGRRTRTENGLCVGEIFAAEPTPGALVALWHAVILTGTLTPRHQILYRVITLIGDGGVKSYRQFGHMDPNASGANASECEELCHIAVRT